KLVLVSGPWQPLQVSIEAWNRASGFLMPGPFHWKKSLKAEPARKLCPSNDVGTVLAGAPGRVARIAGSFWFTKSLNVCVLLNETSGVSLTVASSKNPVVGDSWNSRSSQRVKPESTKSFVRSCMTLLWFTAVELGS